MRIELDNHVPARMTNPDVHRRRNTARWIVQHSDKRVSFAVAFNYRAGPIVAVSIDDEHFETVPAVVAAHERLETLSDEQRLVSAGNDCRAEQRLLPRHWLWR